MKNIKVYLFFFLFCVFFIILLHRITFERNKKGLFSFVKNVRQVEENEYTIIKQTRKTKENSIDFFFIYTLYDCNSCIQDMKLSLNYFLHNEPQYNYNVIIVHNNTNLLKDYIGKQDYNNVNVYQITNKQQKMLNLNHTPLLLVEKKNYFSLGYIFQPNSKLDSFFRNNYKKIIM